METKNKIIIVNKLRDEIDRLECFIALVEKGDIYDEKYSGQNMFRSLIVGADIYTGTDNPRYENEIREGETIAAFVKAGLPVLKGILKLKNEELDNMFL